MKPKKNKEKKMVTIQESTFLSLVSAKLKGRILFPQKVEEAKKYLQNVKKIGP